MPGTPSGRSIVREFGVGGGGYGNIGNPYSASFAGDLAALNLGWKAQEQERLQKGFELSEARESRAEERQKMMDAYNMARQQREDERIAIQQRREERRENYSLMKEREADRKESAYSKIAMLNTHSLNFPQELRETLKDPDVTFALSKSGGREILALQKEMQRDHQNYADSISWNLKNAGLPSNPYDERYVKRDKDTGEHIWDKEFDDYLASGYKQQAEKQAGREKELIAQGYVKQRIVDNDGKEKEVWGKATISPEESAAMATKAGLVPVGINEKTGGYKYGVDTQTIKFGSATSQIPPKPATAPSATPSPEPQSTPLPSPTPQATNDVATTPAPLDAIFK